MDEAIGKFMLSIVEFHGRFTLPDYFAFSIHSLDQKYLLMPDNLPVSALLALLQRRLNHLQPYLLACDHGLTIYHVAVRYLRRKTRGVTGQSRGFASEQSFRNQRVTSKRQAS